MSFMEFMFGSDKGDKNRQAQYDKVANYDNRMNDFKQYSGSALNSLANRGVINSTVGANAMSNALTQAEKNYWDDQQRLLYNYQYDKDNSQGVFPSIMQGIGQIGGTALGGVLGGSTGASLGGSIGGGLGGMLGGTISGAVR